MNRTSCRCLYCGNLFTLRTSNREAAGQRKPLGYFQVSIQGETKHFVKSLLESGFLENMVLYIHFYLSNSSLFFFMPQKYYFKN